MRHACARWLFFGWILLAWAVAEALAASGDADGTYTVTITQVEISSDNGATYATIFSGSQLINIAAANAGAVAASLGAGAKPTPGTYNRVRVTLGANLLLKGYVNNGATTIYTNGATDSAGFTTNAAAANTPGSTYATSTFTIPAASRTATLTTSFVIAGSGASRKVRVAFDTSGVITQAGGIPSVGAPSVSVTSA